MELEVYEMCDLPQVYLRGNMNGLDRLHMCKRLVEVSFRCSTVLHDAMGNRNCELFCALLKDGP